MWVSSQEHCQGVSADCNQQPLAVEYIFTYNGTAADGAELLNYYDCDSELRNGSCQFGTVNDQQTMATISVSGYLIYGSEVIFQIL